MTYKFSCTITIECAIEGYKIFRPLIYSSMLRKVQIVFMAFLALVCLIGSFTDNRYITPTIIFLALFLLSWKVGDLIIWLNMRNSPYTNKSAEIEISDSGIRVVVTGLCDQMFTWDAYDAASIGDLGIAIKHKNKNLCQYFRFSDMPVEVKNAFLQLANDKISRIIKCV
jgi:hypothetical protein